MDNINLSDKKYIELSYELYVTLELFTKRYNKVDIEDTILMFISAFADMIELEEIIQEQIYNLNYYINSIPDIKNRKILENEPCWRYSRDLLSIILKKHNFNKSKEITI